MTQYDDTNDGRLVSAVKEYLRMLDAGTAPPQEQFLQQHADIADQLGPSLAGLAMVHRAADPKPVSLVVPDSEFTARPIGDFQIVGELGRGGMGVVYEAIQLSLGRHVALKVLPFASGLDEVRLQRFKNEAHAAAALHHTNIVPVYAVGSDRGVHYYAMQLIHGNTLAELIANMRTANDPGSSSAANDPPDSVGDQRATNATLDTITRHSTVLSDSSSGRVRYYRSVVRMAHQAASAIEHAHQYGVIHRDIKPANLLLDAAGKIWVTDFGLAQFQAEQTQLTRTGDPMGTLRYMSPEQAAGRRDEIDHRTDIYSLGVTLYELLTLRPAIIGDGYREMLNQVALHDPAPPRSVDPALPSELDTIVRKSIAKSPAERYASAGEFASDLQAWLDDKPIKAKPPTAFERLAKWRRRNSGLVAVAGGVLLLATCGLMATTLLIWREQQHTHQALQREMNQRELAQRSFQQARAAVEAFSNLSESELAYRPELQDLRRSFLETSLEFYQDFLNDRADDPTLAKELEVTSARVQTLVDELRILENISPLLQLNDRRVQAELGLDENTSQTIEVAIAGFREQREAVANQTIAGLTAENNEMTELLRGFDDFIQQNLTDSQRNRLLQINRQRRLPITFKSSEVVAALELSRQQRAEINRIIEETRPGRAGGPPNWDGPPHRDDEDHRIEHRGGKPPRRDHDPFGFAPEGRRPDGPPRRDFDGHRGDDSFGPPPRDKFRDATTEVTVREILAILTPQQRDVWQRLIGKPFHD